MKNPPFIMSRIKKVGINPRVDIPLRVSRAFNRRGYIPVVGKMNDIPAKSTLVPIRGKRHLFFVNGDMMRAAGGRLTFGFNCISPAE